MPYLNADMLVLSVVIALCGLVPAAMALHTRSEAAPAGDPARSGALLAPVDAAAAWVAANRAGFSAVSAPSWERGEWRMAARDAAGTPRLLTLDAWTGRLQAGIPEASRVELA